MKDIKENINKRVQKFKESPVFYIDFDNTLWNTQKVYVETHNKMFNLEADWTKNRRWDFADVCINPYNGYLDDMFSKLIWEMIDQKYDHPDLSIGEYYYDGAVEFINWAVDRGNATLVTVGTDGNIINKGEYIAKTLSKKLAKIYIAKDEAFDVKSKIDMSDGMIIEDRTDILHATNALYRVRFGKAYDWNSDWYPDNITSFSCETWEEVAKLTERLMK